MKTKAFLFIGIVVLIGWACHPVKEVSKTSATLSQKNDDSTLYELVIIDPYFDQWYQINYTEAKDYSNDYYRNKNRTAVINWNDYFRTGKYSEIIDSYIDYRSEIDYGIEVNRKLYWYFKYIKSKYGIRLF